jgi:hypothetical protein
MLREEKLSHDLGPERQHALAQIIVDAWPQEQTAYHISSSLGDGAISTAEAGRSLQELLVRRRPRLRGQTIVRLSDRWLQWPKALGRHFE